MTTAPELLPHAQGSAMTTPDELNERLAAFLQRHHNARSVRIDDLRLLTGGASRQTWSFDASIETSDGQHRNAAARPARRPAPLPELMPRDIEYRLLEAASSRPAFPSPRSARAWATTRSARRSS